MNRKGFSFVEFLVTLGIIAVLAAILFPVFAKAHEKATFCTHLSDAKKGVYNFTPKEIEMITSNEDMNRKYGYLVQRQRDWEKKKPGGLTPVGGGVPSAPTQPEAPPPPQPSMITVRLDNGTSINVSVDVPEGTKIIGVDLPVERR